MKGIHSEQGAKNGGNLLINVANTVLSCTRPEPVAIELSPNILVISLWDPTSRWRVPMIGQLKLAFIADTRVPGSRPSHWQ